MTSAVGQSSDRPDKTPPSFLQAIFARLEQAGDAAILQQVEAGERMSVTARELLAMIGQARAFLSTKGLRKGDRCALLAPNSIRWIALDLALMAENLIVVPLYARQAPVELVAMIKDSSASIICCGDSELRDAIHRTWPENPDAFLLEQIFRTHSTAAGKIQLADSDPVTIIYTSGTSGEAKGVILNAGNIAHILASTNARLGQLTEGSERRDRVFHYLPFCFAGSWIMLLTCLVRGSLLTVNTDLHQFSREMRLAAPDYVLNVPQLLERMRRAVDEQLWKTGGAALVIYGRAKAAWMRRYDGQHRLGDSLWLKLGRALVFPTIRRNMIGDNLKALISGSAPLAVETQLFFMMLGIPVLQVYGLTETTAICTMDVPHHALPGRVGPAIAGIEMKLGENDEIIVRGPNIFPGYWNRPRETENALRDNWFHTGDQGEMDPSGNWKITGRIKNLIILGSGHNIAPEPIEDKLVELAGAQQVVVVGNGRGYLAAILTGDLSTEKVQEAIDRLNARLPHYKQVRAFHIRREPFSVDNGLLTSNGKLKRDLIAALLQQDIDGLYKGKQAS
ncbi:MAG: AMP-binding protein [Acidobacteria bacterium]|nr:AMP-binding protein [Acidobacteriota bacterium]